MTPYNMVAYADPQWRRMNVICWGNQRMKILESHKCLVLVTEAKVLLILPMTWCCSDCLGYYWLISLWFFLHWLKLGFSHIQLKQGSTSSEQHASTLFPVVFPKALISDTLHDSHVYTVSTIWPSDHLNLTFTWVKNTILLWDFFSPFWYQLAYIEYHRKWLIQSHTAN